MNDDTRAIWDFLIKQAEAEGGILHLDGVPWWEAPLPRRWHRCRVQTSGLLHPGELVERCACGAFRLNGRYWIDRNERRKSRTIRES